MGIVSLAGRVAIEEGGDKLGNGSGCHKTDAADVLTHEIQVKGIRLEVGWHLPGTWQNFGRR